MSSVRAALQPAYVLHCRPYRETSLLLSVFTANYGKVSLLVKGVRKKNSRFIGLLQPFNQLRVSWVGKTELQTLIDVELASPPPRLCGECLFCGLYLNELVERFLIRHDPHHVIFSHYADCLQNLAERRDIEQTLRFFEFSLLKEIGYGLQVGHEARTGRVIEADQWYDYVFNVGPVAAAPSASTVRGATLIGLRDRTLWDATSLVQAKRLMRAAIDYHLGGKSLKSRGLFGSSKTA